MKISELFSYIEKNPDDFPNTIKLMQSVSIEILNIWKQAANFSANVPVKSGGTGWFGKQYVNQGNIEIAQKSPFKFNLYYEQYNAKHIDFQKIVEEGRGAFDIAKNLLATSKKVRISPVRKTKGGKYISGGVKRIVVPLGNEGYYNKLNEWVPEAIPSFDMSIKDTYEEPAQQGGGNVSRNEYNYVPIQDTVKNNTARFTQITKNGSQTTSKNLVMVTEKSNWNPYPAIQGTKFSKKMQRVADAKVNAASARFIKALNADLINLGYKK
jgi:hypothetical protein